MKALFVSALAVLMVGTSLNGSMANAQNGVALRAELGVFAGSAEGRSALARIANMKTTSGRNVVSELFGEKASSVAAKIATNEMVARQFVTALESAEAPAVVVVLESVAKAQGKLVEPTNVRQFTAALGKLTAKSEVKTAATSTRQASVGKINISPVGEKLEPTFEEGYQILTEQAKQGKQDPYYVELLHDGGLRNPGLVGKAMCTDWPADAVRNWAITVNEASLEPTNVAAFNTGARALAREAKLPSELQGKKNICELTRAPCGQAGVVFLEQCIAQGIFKIL